MMRLIRRFNFAGLLCVAAWANTQMASAQDAAAPATPAIAPEKGSPAATATEPAKPPETSAKDGVPKSTAATDEAHAPPKAPPKRDDYLKHPGAPRKPLDNYRTTKQQAAQPPAGVRLEDLLRGNNPKDANIDAMAKANVFSITKPGNEADRTILNELNRIADGRGNANPESVKSYKTALVKYLGQVLDNSILVQVNALNLASEIQNGSNDVSDSVALFLKVIEDDKRQDPVLFMALRGLVKARERGLVRANEEQQAVGIILKQLEKSDVQSMLKAKLIETLGALERPYLERPRDAKVATLIAQAAIDQNNDLEVRAAAGKALARMRLSEIQGWNSALQAQVIARALRDEFTRPQPEEANPTKAQEAARLDAYYWAKAIKKASTESPNQSNDDFKSFAQTTALDQILFPILKRETPNIDALSDWIDQHPISDKKLAPNAPEISLVPAKAADGERADAGPSK